MQEKFVTSGHDIRIASIKMNYIDKLQRDTQWVQILSEAALRFSFITVKTTWYFIKAIF